MPSTLSGRLHTVTGQLVARYGVPTPTPTPAPTPAPAPAFDPVSGAGIMGSTGPAPLLFDDATLDASDDAWKARAWGSIPCTNINPGILQRGNAFGVQGAGTGRIYTDGRNSLLARRSATPTRSFQRNTFAPGFDEPCFEYLIEGANLPQESLTPEGFHYGLPPFQSSVIVVERAYPPSFDSSGEEGPLDTRATGDAHIYNVGGTLSTGVVITSAQAAGCKTGPYVMGNNGRDGCQCDRFSAGHLWTSLATYGADSVPAILETNVPLPVGINDGTLWQWEHRIERWTGADGLIHAAVELSFRRKGTTTWMRAMRFIGTFPAGHGTNPYIAVDPGMKNCNQARAAGAHLLWWMTRWAVWDGDQNPDPVGSRAYFRTQPAPAPLGQTLIGVTNGVLSATVAADIGTVALRPAINGVLASDASRDVAVPRELQGRYPTGWGDSIVPDVPVTLAGVVAGQSVTWHAVNAAGVAESQGSPSVTVPASAPAPTPAPAPAPAPAPSPAPVTMPSPSTADLVLVDLRAAIQQATSCADALARAGVAKLGAAALGTTPMYEVMAGLPIGFNADIDGHGTRALEIDWPKTTTQQDVAATLLTYLATPYPKHVIFRWKNRLRAPFTIANSAFGNAAAKRFLVLRDLPDLGGTGRVDYIWAGPSPIHPEITLGAPDNLVFGTNPAFQPEQLIDQVIDTALELQAESTEGAHDGLIRLTVNGTVVLEQLNAAIHATAFERFQFPTVMNTPAQDQTEYWWDIVAWVPNGAASVQPPSPPVQPSPSTPGLSGLQFVGDDFTSYATTADFLKQVSVNVGGTGDWRTALYHDGSNAQSLALDTTVRYNGHPTIRYNFPVGGRQPELWPQLYGNYGTIWFRSKIRFGPGFDTIGPDPASYAYKLLGWGLANCDGSGRLEITNHTQYDLYWGAAVNGVTIVPNDDPGNGPGITTEWVDGAWYEYILEYNVNTPTTGIARAWLTKDGTARGAPMMVRNRAAVPGNLMPPANSVMLGLNFNQTITKPMALWYGQWEVVDGAAHPDPFGVNGGVN